MREEGEKQQVKSAPSSHCATLLTLHNTMNFQIEVR